MTTDHLRDTHGTGYDADLANRFTYHQPTPEQPEVYQAVRDLAHLFALLIQSTSASSREQSLALTHVEQAVMWANAGIARRGLSAAGIAGARDLADHALDQLREVKPHSAWIEEEGQHWAPISTWERGLREVHRLLTDRSGVSQVALTKAYAVMDPLVASPVDEDSASGDDHPDGTDPDAVLDLLNAAARWGQLGVLRVARRIFHPDAWEHLDGKPDPWAEPNDGPEPTPPGEGEASWHDGVVAEGSLMPLVVQVMEDGSVQVRNIEVLGGRGVLVLPPGIDWVPWISRMASRPSEG